MVLLCPQTLLGVLRGFVSAAWQLTTTINHEAHDEVEADDVFGSRLVLSFGASECHRNQEVGWVREVLPRSDAINEVCKIAMEAYHLTTAMQLARKLSVCRFAGRKRDLSAALSGNTSLAHPAA